MNPHVDDFEVESGLCPTCENLAKERFHADCIQLEACTECEEKFSTIRIEHRYVS
jgi:hypothetical protein